MKNMKNLSRRELLLMLGALGLDASASAPAPPKAPDPKSAPDPAKINPRSYKVLLENDRCRVLEYKSRPGLGVCGQGLHYHPAHLTIPLTDGKARVRKADGTYFEASGKAGKVFWAPAETHEVENVSGRGMHAYMIEFKDKDWQPSTG